MAEKRVFEVMCYEGEDGSICLAFDDSAVCFARDRFIEFAGNLNEVREALLRERSAVYQESRLHSTGEMRSN